MCFAIACPVARTNNKRAKNQEVQRSLQQLDAGLLLAMDCVDMLRHEA